MRRSDEGYQSLIQRGCTGRRKNAKRAREVGRNNEEQWVVEERDEKREKRTGGQEIRNQVIGKKKHLTAEFWHFQRVERGGSGEQAGWEIVQGFFCKFKDKCFL